MEVLILIDFSDSGSAECTKAMSEFPTYHSASLVDGQ